ncbi:MAG: GNAT family N-acetyltransferase [Gammaproteobacteria bacterium]
MKWTISPIAHFDRLVPKWDALNDAAGGLPFLHTRFVSSLCREFGDDNLRLALCEGAQGPLAIGILARTGFGQWATFQPSQSPLGAWVMRPSEDWDRVLAGLARALPGLTLAIGVTQQDPDRVPRPADTPCLYTLDYIQTARVPITGTFEDYWSARGKNLRHNMKRQRAKLAQDGISTRLEILTRADEVGPALEEYGRLESAGWKAGYGTAVHPDNAQGRFYRAMMEAYCGAGAGRIYRYRFGDRVVAIDLCIVGGGALVILKTTYDESIKTISPAFLMREEAFRRLFAERAVRRIEFFGKLMEWHTRWTDDVRTLYHVNFYRSRLMPGLKSIAAQFGGLGLPRQHEGV